MKTFFKLFLLTIALIATLIHVIHTHAAETPTWNGDCNSYGSSSYWKDNVCFTSKGARTFNQSTTTVTDTKHVCLLDDNQLNNIINKLKQVQLEYSKMDVMCIDIIKVENEIKDLVNQMFVSRNKTTTNSTTKETPKWIPFPAPTVKWLTKTITVKVCNAGVYDKALDTCILMITGAR